MGWDAHAFLALCGLGVGTGKARAFPCRVFTLKYGLCNQAFIELF